MAAEKNEKMNLSSAGSNFPKNMYFKLSWEPFRSDLPRRTIKSFIRDNWGFLLPSFGYAAVLFFSIWLGRQP
jgi:hypothetical protein